MSLTFNIERGHFNFVQSGHYHVGLTTKNTPELLKDTAQGVLIVDGKRTLIEHIYTVDYNDNDLLIILTDKPVEQHLIPDGIDNLAKAGKLIGMVT